MALPPGALRGPTTFLFQPISAGSIPSPPPGQQPVTVVVQVTASQGGNEVQVFSRLVRIEFRYRGTAPHFIAYWDGQEWVNFETAVDVSSRTASAMTPHLSLFAAFAPLPQGGINAPGGSLPLVPIGLGVAALAAMVAAAFVVRSRPVPAGEGPNP
ncbi:MAG: hypothetical protein ACYDGR_16100 [Candidatus Dormibacteria bacterium]